MTTRSLLLATALLALPTAAFAQAPGEAYGGPSSVAPTVAPAPVVVVNPGRDPMADRWAIGLQFGGMGIAPEDAPEGSEANFATAELNVRFRATRRLEVFLAFAGGRQQLDDDQCFDREDCEGDLAMDMVTLGLRFNFRPASRWNWYLMGGFGSTLIAHHQTPEELRDDLRRPHGMFGIGIEHRWNHFALQAELRGISVGERDDDAEVMPVTDGATRDPVTGIDYSMHEELGGGQFNIGASLYF